MNETKLEQLFGRLDAATRRSHPETICDAVKHTLIESIGADNFELPAEFTATSPIGYARRLLHKTNDYAIVVMTWDAGQGTPIHDHDGKWCVECVYSGEITVRSFDRISSDDPSGTATTEFREAEAIVAGRGAAGSLIPPFDYHIIQNDSTEPAVTIHVYGGEINRCTVFEPIDSERYRPSLVNLSYTD